MNILYDNNTEELIDDDIYILVEKVIENSLLYEKYPLDAEISITFVDNNQIKDINKQYRDIDKVTDVLSFPLLEFEEEYTDDSYDVEFEEEYISLGDIVISLERAREQANDYGHSLKREIGFLICHSMFHLMGYDHIDKDDEDIMKEKQEYVLQELGLYR